MPSVALQTSGERLRVEYHISADEGAARAIAEDICLEQTVEIPAELVPPGDIRDLVVGQIEGFVAVDEQRYAATISYAIENTAFELTQLLNTIFGNFSLKPRTRIERLDLPPKLLRTFGGPRWGRDGLRQRLGVPDRPLLATALKPMGLPATALADLAYQLALGGIDIIKDDHGLSDQPYAPFTERVARCAEAVARANAATGGRAIYLPNVTASGDALTERALIASQVGAGGLLISPGLTGFGAMAAIADDDRIGLPIMSHPAFQGSFVTSPDSGISHFALFGQIARLAGADASIYPNYGGRFSFSRDECQQIADGCATPMDQIKPIFPTPGGGIRLERVPELRALYGRDVIFLVGGGLYTHGPNLIDNALYFRQLVERM
jgi:ribulose-bisphosphate carboxylase large chain